MDAAMAVDRLPAPLPQGTQVPRGSDSEDSTFYDAGKSQLDKSNVHDTQRLRNASENLMSYKSIKAESHTQKSKSRQGSLRAIQ